MEIHAFLCAHVLVSHTRVSVRETEGEKESERLYKTTLQEKAWYGGARERERARAVRQ